MTDFQIADHGSIISIKPVSEAARTWVDENVVSEPWAMARRRPLRRHPVCARSHQ
jgi:hypothetical protein